MDLRELTAFQTIIQEGTFSKAAAKLNYAQSTITNQIQRLEKELGIPLFKRGWEAELTPAGMIFAGEVDQLIQHWLQVKDQAKSLEREEIGSLRVGAVEMLSHQVLPNVLRRFQEYKPRIACHFVVGNTQSLTARMLQNELDFAICGEPEDIARFYFEPLYEERITFIAAQDHPLAQGKGIRFEELLDYPVIVGGPSCLYHLRLARRLARSPKMPLLHTVSQISAIPGFVVQVPSVGAVLDSMPLPDGVVKLDVELQDEAIPVGLLRLRMDHYNSSFISLIAELVREELGNKRPNGF